MFPTKCSEKLKNEDKQRKSQAHGWCDPGGHSSKTPSWFFILISACEQESRKCSPHLVNPQLSGYQITLQIPPRRGHVKQKLLFFPLSLLFMLIFSQRILENVSHHVCISFPLLVSAILSAHPTHSALLQLSGVLSLLWCPLPSYITPVLCSISVW